MAEIKENFKYLQVPLRYPRNTVTELIVLLLFGDSQASECGQVIDIV
jgi:hypothetical protein